MARDASIRLSGKTVDRLDRHAAAVDQSRSAIVEKAVDKYLDYEEWFIQAVQEGIESSENEPLIPHEDVVAEMQRRISEARTRKR